MALAPETSMRAVARRTNILRLGAFACAIACVLTLAAPAGAMPGASNNFLGMGTTNTPTVQTGDPPDTTGAVGPSNYVQAVNGGIEVFNKNGTVAQAAKSTNTLWAGYVGVNAGNHCADHNDGEPIVRYDRAADRWLIAQFSIPNSSTADSGPSFECVAVSKTSDPTGAYWLYDFKYSYAINESARIGVWPDAYYATFDMYGTSAFKGAEVCAWNRAAMLNGQAATQQCFFLANPGSPPPCPSVQPFVAAGILPANLDGALPPPTGSPEYLMQFDNSQCGPTYNQLDLWKFHVDWTTPVNSALTGPTVLTVNNFTPACWSASTYTPTCIPQPGTTTKLDARDDRLMDRLAYRNFGTYESLVLNHTVSAGAGAGVRWYEVRSPATTPTVYQQGTYAPSDTNWRWMGSIAQDQAGDIALGYSVSSSSGGVTHPSIGWTGRLGTDTTMLGQMTQAESIIDTGAANAHDDSGTGRARWGDFSSMTVDPADDCTFWYTNEVAKSSSSLSGWDTYIASVKFPNCGANDFTIAPSPTMVTANQGASGAATVSTTSTKGTAETITLSAWDLPPGATASFNPASVTAGSSSTLTLTAGSSTPVGTYTVQVGGTAPSAVHGTSVTFTVQPGSGSGGNGGGSAGNGGGSAGNGGGSGGTGGGSGGYGGAPGGNGAPPSSFTLGPPTVGKNGVLTFRLAAPAAGSFTATASTTLPAAADKASVARHKKKSRPRRIVYGSASVTTSYAGAVTLVIRPSGAAKAALAKGTSLTVRITVTFTPVGGTPTTHQTTVTVKAPKRHRTKHK